MLNLTRAEKAVILFLLFAGMVGLGIKQYHLSSKEIPSRSKSFDFSRPVATLDEIIQEETIININTANSIILQRLPGIGPAIAQRIITYRETHGPFKTIAQIKEVKGIGEKKFLGMKERIVIE